MDLPGTVTRILKEAAGGHGRDALDRLLPLLYEELGRLARSHLQRAGREGELDTRALVHEAYLRMLAPAQVSWVDRAHFFAYASRAMRSLLVDRARRRARLKRGAGEWVHTLEEHHGVAVRENDDLLALDEALVLLQARDPRLVRVVECRFFAGLAEAETAAALGVSERTVRRDWLKARAFLQEALGVAEGRGDGEMFT